MAIYKLDDLLESYTNSKKPNLPQKIINTGDVSNGQINPKLEKNKVLGQFKKVAQINDILFSEIRPGNGRWALVKEDISDCLISTKMLVLRVKKVVIPEYALLILTNILIGDIVQIANSRSGTFPQITFSNISHLEVDIPSIEEQQKIIDIIKPFDDMINNLIKQINLLKNVLINNYKLTETRRVNLADYINLSGSKYNGQEYYLATSAVGELTIDVNKKQSVIDSRPSRANLTPSSNSIIFSKLDGENKIMYIDKDFEYVVSTGFYNINTEYLDHVIGFLLSENFKKQKTLLSTGTTMVGLNNNSLNKIVFNEPQNSTDQLTIQMNNLIKIKIQLEKQRDKMVKLLIN